MGQFRLGSATAQDEAGNSEKSGHVFAQVSSRAGESVEVKEGQ
jgi:hypothetical protein